MIPRFSQLLASRRVCLAIVAGAGVHLGLVSLGLPSWQCPIRRSLGIPCPGCGLTRALQALAVADWPRAMATHAFAPVAAMVLLLVLLAAIAPTVLRNKLTRHLAEIEQRTGITLVLSTTLLLYWLARIIFFRRQLYDWVM